MMKIKTIICLSLFAAIFFHCKKEDDGGDGSGPMVETQMIDVSLFEGHDNVLCFNEEVLELIDDFHIVHTMVCGQGANIVVESIDPDGCVHFSLPPNFLGAGDEICVIHCFDDSDSTCDTTFLQPTVYESFNPGVFILNEGPFQTGDRNHYPFSSSIRCNL